MTITVHDAVKYDLVDQLAREFFYDKCHGYPDDIIKSIEQLITDTAKATRVVEDERKILERVPF